MATDSVVFVAVTNASGTKAAVVVNDVIVTESAVQDEADGLRAMAEKLCTALGITLKAHVLKDISFDNWAQTLNEVKKGTGYQVSEVEVKHWNCYGSDCETVTTHILDVVDQRQHSGQLFAGLALMGSGEDDTFDKLSISLEVNTDPITGFEPAPCVHVHFHDDELACSMFKIGQNILIRPERNVQLEAVSVPVGVGNAKETMYWLKGTGA